MRKIKLIFSMVLLFIIVNIYGQPLVMPVSSGVKSFGAQVPQFADRSALSRQYTPTLSSEFSLSAQKSVFGQIRSQSGFIDDPDPVTPADPLTDPFIDDPDPFTPADPLANTPIGDLPMLVVVLCMIIYYVSLTLRGNKTISK